MVSGPKYKFCLHHLQTLSKWLLITIPQLPHLNNRDNNHSPRHLRNRAHTPSTKHGARPKRCRWQTTAMTSALPAYDKYAFHHSSTLIHQNKTGVAYLISHCHLPPWLMCEPHTRGPHCPIHVATEHMKCGRYKWPCAESVKGTLCLEDFMWKNDGKIPQ